MRIVTGELQGISANDFASLIEKARAYELIRDYVNFEVTEAIKNNNAIVNNNDYKHFYNLVEDVQISASKLCDFAGWFFAQELSINYEESRKILEKLAKEKDEQKLNVKYEQPG